MAIGVCARCGLIGTHRRLLKVRETPRHTFIQYVCDQNKGGCGGIIERLEEIKEYPQIIKGFHSFCPEWAENGCSWLDM